MSHAPAFQPVIIHLDAPSSFFCDYVTGINRVLSLPPYLLVDNIGRNFEVWRFESGGREPVGQTRYDLTSHPGDPIASLLDVDIHAAFLRGDGRELLAVNHYGRARAFHLPAAGARMQPIWERQLLGDAERIVMCGDCFIASSPRGEYTDDPAQPGVFVFAPVTSVTSVTSSTAELKLACDQELADWGVIGALAVSASGDRLAVAAGPRLGVFNLSCGSAGARLGDCLWEAALNVHCQWIEFDAHARVWASGFLPPSSTASIDHWDACRGGQVEAFTVDRGARVFTAALPESTAWGYGADPVVLAPDCRNIYVLGRDASLHAIDGATGASRCLYDLPDTMNVMDGASMGIGHAALRDGWLYAGFSRGGFRLVRYDLCSE
jgi:hypothetical protein